MNEYQIIMSTSGLLILLGIALTAVLFIKLEKYGVQGKVAFLGAVIGGILISMGFIGGMMNPSKGMENILLVLLLTGPGLMIYSFSAVRVLGLTKRFVSQFLAILLSIFMFRGSSNMLLEMLYVGTLLGLFVLVNTILFLPGLSNSTRLPAYAASWLLVAYSWLRAFVNKGTLDTPSFLILSLYLGALALWLYSVITIYRRLS